MPDAMPRHGCERTAYLASTIDARPILRELAKRLDLGLELFNCFRFQRHAECHKICSADRESAQDRSKSETHQPARRNLGSRRRGLGIGTAAMLPGNIQHWGTLVLMKIEKLLKHTGKTWLIPTKRSAKICRAV